MTPTSLLYPEVLLTLIPSVVLSGMFCFLPLGNLLLCYLVGAHGSLIRCLHFFCRGNESYWLLVLSVYLSYFSSENYFSYTVFVFIPPIVFLKKILKLMFLGVAEYFKVIACSK